jgi:hypothetical protein
MVDNDPFNTYVYVLTVYTGLSRQAETTSHVRFMVIDINGQTTIRRLEDDNKQVYIMSNDRFQHNQVYFMSNDRFQHNQIYIMSNNRGQHNQVYIMSNDRCQHNQVYIMSNDRCQHNQVNIMSNDSAQRNCDISLFRLIL